MENCFFSRDLFADVMSVHNRNMKHAHAIEFDYTNLLAMLRHWIMCIYSIFMIAPALLYNASTKNGV